MIDDEPRSTASPGYAWALLHRALATAAEDPDPEVRKRALAKAAAWRAVLEGMASGRLTVGSRTPVADTPAWVTLEVAHGGFATGRYVAEGELQPHEIELLAQIGAAGGSTDRERLNAWFLGDAGQQDLARAVEEGRYRIGVPEEGALPVVAWLLARGHAALALELIESLRSLMHRLRFYPRLEAVPRPAGASVRLVPVGKIAQQMRKAPVQPRVAAMNEALQVWNPLYDQLVALWVDTIDDVSGFPCRRWPADFGERREAWLAAYRAAAAAHRSCGKHAHPKSNFRSLRVALEQCRPVLPPGSGWTVSEVGRVGGPLWNTIAKHGAPGSAQRTTLRREQAAVAARPTHAQLAHVVARRLERWPADGGLPSLEPIAVDVREGEDPRVPAGTAVPSHLLDKAARALEAPIEELIARGVIPSSEVLAQVLPQITSQVAASAIADPALQGLYGQIYAAFRKRRSLLLLNLAHQVQLDELPWVAALERFRTEGVGSTEQARQTLEQVTWLALASFPQTLLPNPLVREMAALAGAAGLKLPLVEEVAADIFMGTFTRKWATAADKTSRILAGTLYARYYDLPEVVPDFAALCKARAAEAGTGGSFVAQNGAILEQSQILTSHNLAVLVDELGLTQRLASQAPELVEQVFDTIVRAQNQSIGPYKARLQMLKNTAYAWRQAIFLLSLTEPPVQVQAVAGLEERLVRADEGRVARFSPAVAGLRWVVEGGRFDRQGRGIGKPDAVRFLGWAAGRHWMLGPSAG